MSVNDRVHRVSVNLNQLEFDRLKEIANIKNLSLSKTCAEAVRRQIYAFGEGFTSPSSRGGGND